MSRTASSPTVGPTDIWLFPAVDVYVSGAVLGSKSAVWHLVSNFGNLGDLSFPVDGQRLRTALMVTPMVQSVLAPGEYCAHGLALKSLSGWCRSACLSVSPI